MPRGHFGNPVVNGKRKCTKCGETKPVSEFQHSKRAPTGLIAQCKACHNAYMKTQYPRKRHINYVRAYGITLTDYNKMFAEQEGCCAICGKHQSEFKKALDVDHNHLTNQVRGLLCGNCNNGLGRFYADYGIELLTNAINYLGVN